MRTTDRSIPWRTGSPRRARRGVALILVLVAVVVAFTLALSFQAAQSTATPIARNVNQHATARSIAESAMAMTLHHLKTSPAWRQDFAGGLVPTHAAFGEGSFSVEAIDGQDVNGDGQISIADGESDGDLDDDPSDPVTLRVIGRLGNVTHRVSAVVVPADLVHVKLLYVLDSGGPWPLEQQRIDLFKSWGYQVVTISENASRASIDSVIASEGIQVAYLSTFVQGSMAGKIDHIRIGVVTEEEQTYPLLGIASAGNDARASAIRITHNAHYITSVFDTGLLTITTDDMLLKRATGIVASGALKLAESASGSDPSLLVLERGATSHSGGVVPGRRVMLPWSGSSFDFALNDAGRTLLRRATQWAAADAPPMPGLWAEWFDVSSRLSSLSGIDWESNPTHTSIETQVNWPSTGGALYSGGPTETFGLKLSGRIRIPADGTWTFYTYSDDGSDLWINGVRVVDNDGLHAMRERSGTINLAAGEHDIVIRVFENGGGVGLIARWAGPGQSKQVIPASAFTLAPGDGDDEDEQLEPQRLALYDFEPPAAIDPVLVAHWKLDESGGAGGGGVAAIRRIRLDDDSIIDSYNATLGSYGGANVAANANLATNMTTGAKIHIKGDAALHGNAWSGPGSNPNIVIQVNNGSTLTGTRQALSSALTAPKHSAPSGSFSHFGNKTYSSNQTWNANRRFGDLTLESGAVVTVSGHIVVDVTNHLTMRGGSRIVVPADSSLTLYVNDDVVIDNASRLNADSSATDRFTLIQYGGSGGKVEIKNASIVAGRIEAESKVLIDGKSILYGSLLTSGDIDISGESRVRVDTSQPGIGLPVPVTDSAADHDGHALNGPAIGAGGAVATTATAFAFDGSNDYVEIPHQDAFLLNDGTLSFWFRAADRDRFQGLVTKDSLNRDDGGHLAVLIDGGRVRVRLQTTTQDHNVYSSPISNQTWHHVALTWGSGGMKLYLDGVEQDAASHTGGLGDTSGGSGNREPWVLGANSWNSDNQSATPLYDFFAGRLDDVRVYDSALVASQIARLAAGEEPGPAYPPVAYDTSNYGSPLDLTIADPARVTWVDDGLRIDQPTLLSSAAAAKIAAAVAESDQMTLEALFTPANLTQTGPAAVAAIAPDSFQCNVYLGQDAAAATGQLRTGTTGSNGTPAIEGDDAMAAAVQHVVLTYDGQSVRLYRNGQLEHALDRAGALDSWNAGYPLTIANTLDNARPWLGTLHRVAVWDRGMNGLQVANLYAGQPPGDGKPSGFFVRWHE